MTTTHAFARDYLSIQLLLSEGRYDEAIEMLEDPEEIVDLAGSDAQGSTLLHKCAHYARIDPRVIELLVARGVSVDARVAETRLSIGNHFPVGATPLYAACSKNNEAVARTLLALGADPNACSQKKRTPLHEAAWAGNTCIGQMLLDHGANLDAMDENGFAPIHTAIVTHEVGFAAWMVLHGADLSLVTNVSAQIKQSMQEPEMAGAIQAAIAERDMRVVTLPLPAPARARVGL